MTIHPDMIRKMVAHGGDLQEAYGAVMASMVPPQFRRFEASDVVRDEMRNKGLKGGASMRHKALSARSLIAPEVLALHLKGLSATAIAKQVCVSRHVVYKILADPDAHIQRRDLRTTMGLVAQAKGMTLEDLMRQDRRAAVSRVRDDAVLAARRAGYGLVEIGDCLGRDHSTISDAEKRAMREKSA